MIVVRMNGMKDEEIHVQADTWKNDEGNLNCLNGDEIVATFRAAYWSAVYESGAVTKPPAPIALS